ncbi:taxilin alpha [Lasallia pustulata]|uniref:Taxilin alpha n=1 Tax=Lasallia pustulata TaxID=136370 RepID=A0A1W5CUJ4_9LECA|nr:taxilin alpha [Lasallia pustulata]
MAGVTSQPPTAPTSSRSSSVVNGNTALDYINGHAGLSDSPASTATQPIAPAAPAAKKSKGKKAADPSETGKLLAAKINQLELDAAGEKDQEAEIEREVKKATRDLTSLLTGMETPLSRLEAVQKKYTELLADMKRLDREHVKSKKRADQLQKDKDHGRSELSKTVSMKEKLEKLCRELTRENKKMKEEHKKLEDSEKRSREILGERVEGMIWEVEEVMQQKENPESQKLNMEMDELFRQKFKSFLDQYELRELHFHSLTRTKDCEVQFNLARYEQQRKIAENEATRSRTLSAQVSTFSQTETELRSQLNIYVEKFKQVEDTLNNSNDLFLTFRKEMEEMSKKTKRLEKENLNLTRKHDLTNRNILEMAEERTRINKEMETLRKKNNTLESVIRRMQDQGRGPAAGGVVEGDEEGTESDYEEDEYDEEDGSEDAEYDDDTEEEALQASAGGLSAFGPTPPPPPPAQTMGNGRINGEPNGIKH